MKKEHRQEIITEILETVHMKKEINLLECILNGHVVLPHLSLNFKTFPIIIQVKSGGLIQLF
jgi:hypothetical protein